MCCEVKLDNKNVYSPPNVIIQSPENAQRAAWSMRDAKLCMTISYAEPASVSQWHRTVWLDKKRGRDTCSFFPQCIQVANFYSYCRENISFLVGRKIFAWIKKKKKEQRQDRFYLCIYGGVCQTINKLACKISRCETWGYCAGFVARQWKVLRGCMPGK